jgi:hypothetical protein
VKLDNAPNFRILMIVKLAEDANGRNRVVIVPVLPLQIK